MSQYDVTKFININDEEFVGHYDRVHNPNGFTFKAGEERVIQAHIAEVMAKHLIDIVLGKMGVKDTNKDSPLRRSMFAKILPELPEKNPEVKKLSPEDEKVELKKVIEKQEELMAQMSEVKGLQAKVAELGTKDKAIADMQKQIEELTKAVAAAAKSKGGRPKKVVAPEAVAPAPEVAQ